MRDENSQIPDEDWQAVVPDRDDEVDRVREIVNWIASDRKVKPELS